MVQQELLTQIKQSLLYYYKTEQNNKTRIKKLLQTV